jgi:prepilin-type N-terminal cleavage/methylation domain-containing protein
MENNRSFLICGFTLVELVVVVAIISIIAVVAVGKYSGLVEKARVCAAESDLKAIADAFTNEENGYLRDMRGIPGFSPACLRIGNLLVSTNVYGVAPGGECVRLDLAKVDGCAAPEAFVKWNEEARRGWHGPYVRHASGAFPAAGERRFPDDSTFGSRGFYPPLSGLLVAQDFVNRRDGCSIYGFPGEPAVIDPWGNPYVLQVPPPQAFLDVAHSVTGVTEEIRLSYARVVSAGPDGRLDTPCFAVNATNRWMTAWSPLVRRLCRQAGLADGSCAARGDDIVLFLMRNDVDEGEAR